MQANDISSFYCPTQIHLGVGSHTEVLNVLRARGCKRLFVVSDAALIGTEFFSGIERLVSSEKIAIGTFSEIEPDPSVRTVEKALEHCRAHEATDLLAIGGGSTIDVAKAVGILTTNGGRIHDYEGIEKFSVRPLPLIAIPTTAGTGSEVSGSCVITDTDRNLKMSIRHAALNPASVAILDPLALRSMPAQVAAHSGMDAFVHAFEAYLSRRSNLITDSLTLQGIELIAGNIRQLVANRENLDAGLKMLCGSALAGIAFGQTGLGNVHCMARFVGARYHLSHGFSNAICLPPATRFNLCANPEKYARVAFAMGRPAWALPTLDAAAMAVEAIEALCRDLGIPSRLRDVGAKEADFDEMADLCEQAGYNRWNPRHTTRADFRALFQQTF